MHSPSTMIALGLRLAELTRVEGIAFRLFGSCAVYIKCTESPDILERNNRPIKDVDAVIARRDLYTLRKMFRDEGWYEEVEVTALTDGGRLRFRCDEHDATLDVIVDCLQFNQTLWLNDRLLVDWPTISVTDLLLSKFQIANLATSDIIDVAALLNQFKTDQSDEAGICLQRICSICGRSWRWHQAILATCAKLGSDTIFDAIMLSIEQRTTIAMRVNEIRDAVRSTPKSFGWVTRNLIGERIPWVTPVETF